jgi:DNA-binding response OmpR family regulator
MIKILIVEDEPKVAAFLKQGLEESGYLPQVVVDGIAGKKLALSNHYDLILLDVIIPHIGGI